MLLQKGFQQSSPSMGRKAWILAAISGGFVVRPRTRRRKAIRVSRKAT